MKLLKYCTHSSKKKIKITETHIIDEESLKVTEIKKGEKIHYTDLKCTVVISKDDENINKICDKFVDVKDSELKRITDGKHIK